MARAVVINTNLMPLYPEEHVRISVDSPDWFAWLESVTSFRFQGYEGSFSAQKTRASNGRGRPYWYAYRRWRGRLFNLYLGRSEQMTLSALQKALSRLEQRIHESIQPEVQKEHLLITRTHPPRLPENYISRPQLIAQINQAVKRPITLLSASAGSGKTSILTEWAATTTRSVAWLSLETNENDPSHFLAYLIATFAKRDTRIGQTIQPARSWNDADHLQLLIDLLNNLTNLLQQETVLILDHYHLLNHTSIHILLQFLITHLPERLHIILATRFDPPFPLADLRARNQLSELNSEDLRFNTTQTAAFVETMDLHLTQEAVNLLYQRSQGWITGIQLLALALQDQKNPITYLQTLGGNHPFLHNYLYDEVLAKQTPDIQRFLLQTAVPEYLSSPLSNILTERTDSQIILTELTQKKLFLIPMDEKGIWYQYHPLFSEALRAHLSTHEPALLKELYRRTGSWYEEQKQPEEAYKYTFLAGDISHAAALLADLVPLLIAQGKLTRLQQWLTQIPASLVITLPSLALASIWLQCQTTGIEDLITQIEQQAEHANVDRTFQSELTLYQAWAALSQADISRSLALVEKTLYTHLKPASTLDSLLTVRKHILLSAAYRADGNLEAAEEVLLKTPYTSQDATEQLLNLFTTTTLANLYEAQGQLRKMGNLYQRTLQILKQGSNCSHLLYILIQVRRAAFLYECNKLAEAKIAIIETQERIKNIDVPIPYLNLFQSILHLRILRATGEDKQAEELLINHDFDAPQLQIGTQMTLLRDAIPAYATPAQLALTSGQIEQAAYLIEARNLPFENNLKLPLTSNDFADYVTFARILLIRGRIQQRSTYVTRALTILDRLRNAIVGIGCHGWFMEIQMLTALALQSQGKTKRALQTLGPILAQAEQEGYLRLFADEGQPMQHLLSQIAPYTSVSARYLQKLQIAIQPAPGKQQDTDKQVLPDPLSLREKETLLLLADGLSNQQIADQLVISLNTVKRHVRHLLAKLTVTNRTQAVTRARKLGLISL